MARTTAARQESEAAKNAPPVLSGKAVLRADHLQRVFVDGERRLEVLRSASLSLRPGEVTALVGRSGSGKSTLLHLLGLLDLPSGGDVLIDDIPAANLSEKQRAAIRNQYIGFVFQHFFLLPEFNVLENVLMPAQIACTPLTWLAKRGEFRDRALALLEEVGLTANAKQKVGTLSGGERQRVALARALILQPRVLLCDEPTGNLDPETALHIMDLIFEMCRNEKMAVLIVTHDAAVSQRADRVLRLDHGALSSQK